MLPTGRLRWLLPRATGDFHRPNPEREFYRQVGSEMLLLESCGSFDHQFVDAILDLDLDGIADIGAELCEAFRDR